VDIRSAAQLRDAVLAALPADAYIGAAAVADWTPGERAAHKLKKQPGVDRMTLELVRTADVLAEVAAHPLRPAVVVGFAAETGDVLANARAKLAAKRVDLVAANRVGVAGSGFEAETNALTLLGDGFERELGPGPKVALAGTLVELVAEMLAGRSGC
jgi:phosphopantothenoylcysteine decarboxylase/phosphopantothenate--cysteine ligase